VKSEGRKPRAEGNSKGEIRKVLVCFAVKEEALAFQQLAGEREQSESHPCGHGEAQCGAGNPRCVGDGSAAGVNLRICGRVEAGLAMGTVVFAADPETGLEPALLAAGAKPARFHCAERVVATIEEKRALCESTGADAVEMESQPSATYMPEAEDPQRDRAGDSGLCP
jgi:hypothetical protein